MDNSESQEVDVEAVASLHADQVTMGWPRRRSVVAGEVRLAWRKIDADVCVWVANRLMRVTSLFIRRASKSLGVMSEALTVEAEENCRRHVITYRCVGAGYRGCCLCGWRSPSVGVMSTLAPEVNEHLEEMKHEWGSLSREPRTRRSLRPV